MKSNLLRIGLVLYGLTSMASNEWDGSRTLPVHRIPVINEDGDRVVPTFKDSLPMSMRTTCGVCHDYARIESGYHFNAAGKDVPHGRPGEPWVWVDERAGTQLPLSYRNWAGTWHPDDVGLTPWDLTQRFGSHMTGGGISDPDDFDWGPRSRWGVSGKLEINCLSCHNASRQQDMTEWTKQIARENFRWAATASAGIGSVGGTASRMSSVWDVRDGPRAGDSAFIFRPGVLYDVGLFDPKGLCMIDIADTPEDRRCFHCHSVARHGATRTGATRDVHSAAGLGCTDCHDNGLDHDINRGTGSDNPHSCEDCHMRSGKYGAPRPRHKGLPPMHFDALTCTACHSGYIAEDDRVRVRTSRANRLGIFGIAQWARDIPFLAQPVLLPDEEGRLAPHRVIWPSFWAKVDGDTLTPIDPAVVRKAGAGVLEADLLVGEVLQAIGNAEEFKGTPVLVTQGEVYQRNFDGGVDRITADSVVSDGWFKLVAGKIEPLVPDFEVPAEIYDLDEAASLAISRGFRGWISLARRGETPAFQYKDMVLQLDVEEGWVRTNIVGSLGFGLMQSNGTFRTLLEPEQFAYAVDTIESESFITEPKVARVLATLGTDGGRYAYVSNGQMFTLDKAGALGHSPHASAKPYAWPLGHDVRPTAQSLGAKGCKECHSADAPFFIGAVTALGPLMTEHSTTATMDKFAGFDSKYHRLFGLSFLGRPLFKLVMTAFAFLFLLVVLSGLHAALSAGLLSFLGRGSAALGRLCVAVTAICTVVLAVGGFFLGTWRGGLSGFALLCHTVVGAVFVVALGVSTVVGIARDRGAYSAPCAPLSSSQKIFGWASVACGLLLVGSILIAMVPLLGDHGQHVAIVTHRVAAVIALAVLPLFALASRRARRRLA